MNPSFTASEIASALGKKRENVHRLLRGTPHSGTRIVSGNQTHTWALSSIPRSLVEQLRSIAIKGGFPDETTYLSQHGKPWQPAVSLSKCRPEFVAEAIKLRQVIQLAIGREKLISDKSEFERVGVMDYERVFKKPISTRHWRSLYARTFKRAGAIQDFNRLEIYLSERAVSHAETPTVKTEVPDSSISERLEFVVANFKCPSSPALRERDYFWTEVMQAHDESARKIGESRAGRNLRAMVRRIATWGAPTASALQKTYSRKRAAWLASGGSAKSVADRRQENSGIKFVIPDEDVREITKLATFHFHGHIAAAWREAHRLESISEATRLKYPLSNSKSQVPKAVREAIGSDVDFFMQLKLGRKAIDDFTPHVDRNYEGIFSCDVFNADDFTLPVYFYSQNERGGVDLARGQCLIFICFRSWKIVGWSFQPDPNYSSSVIRALCTHIFSELAVPKMLYFERGIWKNSRLLTGSKSASEVPLEETVQGLREFGIEIVHATKPRSKTVERVGGLLQDLMEGEPGYCGRDERHDCPDQTKRALDDARAGRIDPSSKLYSFDEWHKRLGEIIEKYNATPQQGRVLEGLSPNEAFDKFLNASDPPVQFGAELRYLLASHKEFREVKTSGIQFRIGKNGYRYYGPELAPFVGRKVLTWFDVENPEYLVITDEARRNPILVPRAHEVSAMASLTGGEAELKAELARAKAQTAHHRIRFNVIKSMLPKRANIVTKDVLKTGMEIDRLRSEETTRKVQSAKTNRIANELGINVPREQLPNKRTESDLRDVQRFLEEHLPKT